MRMRLHLSERFDWRIAAPALVLLAGVSWGLIGLFSRPLSNAGLDPVQITVTRCAIVSLALGCYLLAVRPAALRIRLRDMWLFVGTGVLSFAFFNVCYFASIEACGLSVATILMNTAPCFIVALSCVLFKERFTARKGSSLLLATVGCLLVVGIGSGAQLSFEGIALGLGSGFGYALYTLFARVALKRYDGITVTFYTFLFAFLSLVFACDPATVVAIGFSAPGVTLPMIALALVSTLLPFACYTSGLAHMDAGKASIMTFVEPLVAAVIGVGLFGEVLTMLNVAGIMLIIAGVSVINLPERKKPGRAMA